MKIHLLILFAAAAVLVGATAPTAQAQTCGGYGWGYGYLYNSLEYNVPYFAAHPPVYYSYPVPRTYGYSPFAYPPHVMTPEVVHEGTVQPAVIINPYVPSNDSHKAEPPEDRTASASSQPQPLVIINPYVSTSSKVARTD